MNQLVELLKNYRTSGSSREKRDVLEKYKRAVFKISKLEDDFEDVEVDLDAGVEADFFVEELSDDPRIQNIFSRYIEILAANMKASIENSYLFIQVAEGVVTPVMKKELALYETVDLAYKANKSESEAEEIQEALDEYRKFNTSMSRKEKLREKLGTIKYKKREDIVEFAEYAKIVLDKAADVEAFFKTIREFYETFYESPFVFDHPHYKVENLFDLVLKKDPDTFKIVEGIRDSNDDDLIGKFEAFSRAVIRFQSKFEAKLKEPATVAKHAPFFAFQVADLLNSRIFSESESVGTLDEMDVNVVSTNIGGLTFLSAQIGEDIIHRADKNIHDYIVAKKIIEIDDKILLRKEKNEVEYEIFPDGKVVEFRPKALTKIRFLGETLPNRLKLISSEKEFESVVTKNKRKNLNAPNFGDVGYSKGVSILSDSVSFERAREILKSVVRKYYPEKYKTMFDIYEERVAGFPGGVRAYIQDITTPLIFLTEPISKYEKSLKNLLPFYNLRDCSKFKHKFDVFENASEENVKQVIEFTNIIHKELISRVIHEADRVIDPSIRVAKIATNISYISSKLSKILGDRKNSNRKKEAALKIQRAYRNKKNVRWSAKLKTSQNYIDYIKSLEKDRCSDIKKKYDKLISTIDDKYKNYTEVINIKKSYKKKCK